MLIKGQVVESHLSFETVLQLKSEDLRFQGDSACGIRTMIHISNHNHMSEEFETFYRRIHFFQISYGGQSTSLRHLCDSEALLRQRNVTFRQKWFVVADTSSLWIYHFQHGDYVAQ